MRDAIRRKSLAGVLIAAFATGAYAADTYPTKPVRVRCPTRRAAPPTSSPATLRSN